MPPGFLGFLTVVSAVLLAWVIARQVDFRLRRVVVWQWQVGLVYIDGRFRREVGPGAYWIFGARRALRTVSVRPDLVTTGPIDAVTSDRMACRVRLSANFGVVDARLALELDEAFSERLRHYLELTGAEQAAKYTLSQIVDDRSAYAGAVTEAMHLRAAAIGLKVDDVSVSALTLPPETRRLYTEIERARLEGQAALERARGEQAALRSLANAAQMLRGNPELMNLRLLQLLASPAGKTAPTLVLGGMDGLRPLQTAPVQAAGPGQEGSPGRD